MLILSYYLIVVEHNNNCKAHVLRVKGRACGNSNVVMVKEGGVVIVR